MTESEIWKDIVGYEGLYKVSDKGNIYSVERINSNGRKCGGIILKPRPTINGYLQVILCKNGKIKNSYIHRLVAEAFVPNSNNYPEVNHLDEDKANNYVKNLEWCTSKYNVNHGTRNEKISQKLSKKVRAVNVETGDVITFKSTHEAGRKGYDQSGVAVACRGDYKNSNGKLIGDGHLYRGHRWSYE